MSGFLAKKHSFSLGTACTATFGLAFSLTACDIVDQANSDDTLVSSSSVAVPESSSVPESSNDETTWSLGAGKAVFDKNPYELDAYYNNKLDNFPVCGAENEGSIETLVGGNPKYGTRTHYFKCKQGVWYEIEASITCSTVGISVGDVCKAQTSQAGFQWGNTGYACYKYTEGGDWEKQECPAGPDMECNAENAGIMDTVSFANATDYYQCSGEYWFEINEEEYRCTTVNTTLGDTCIFEATTDNPYYSMHDGKRYFVYERIDSEGDDGRWVEYSYDPKFGFCGYNYNPGEVSSADGEYYYCYEGEWLTANLVPQQYTDPRKEGLTDEEYDVLDLPSEAEVGDRMGGLLEYCYNSGAYVEEFKTRFCMPQNYYRYREDGSWTLETRTDLENETRLSYLACTPETEGVEWSSLPMSYRPGATYKRTKVSPWQRYEGTELHTYYECEDEFVGYDFGRTE